MSKKNKLSRTFIFSPKNIKLKNDSLHDHGLIPFTEWWYFDASFDNGYTAQVGIRLLSLLKLIVVFTRLDIYKDGQLISHERKTHYMPNFKLSKEKPFIKIAGKETMKGFIDEKTQKWVYDISLKLQTTSADLRFTGSTKGWMGNVPGSIWAVVLPRAEVEGTLETNKKIINVKGEGYHDHNWNIKPQIIFSYGWYWGKTNSKNYSITWASVIGNKRSYNTLLMINEKNGGYININPKNIELILGDYRKFKKKKIPYNFQIKVKDGITNIELKLKILDIHHVKIMGFMNYFRYHVIYNGFIDFKGKKEEINEMRMAELLIF
jgi:predicted secreted hydrolase